MILVKMTTQRGSQIAQVFFELRLCKSPPRLQFREMGIHVLFVGQSMIWGLSSSENETLNILGFYVS
jgi:hypothetical protein